MTPELLSSIVAILLSLAASYLPGFSDWYASLAPTAKRLVMLVLLAITSALSLALACAGYAQPAGISLTCDQAGGIALFKSFVAALVANQATFAITPKSSSRIHNHPASSRVLGN